MVIFGEIFEVTQGEITTASTILLSVVGIMVLRQISKPLSSYKIAIIILCTAGLIFAFRLLGWVFGTTTLSTKSILLCINFGIMADTFLRFIGFLIQNTERMIFHLNATKAIRESKS
jgi:cation-transporting ATPase E